MNPVEIVELAVREQFAKKDHSEYNMARAIIAALEAAGYRVMAREPTEEMVVAYWNALANPQEAFHAMHDAAPRYGEPSG